MKRGKWCGKRFLSGILALTLALAVPGCGKGGEDAPQFVLQEEEGELPMIEAFVPEELDLDAEKWLTDPNMQVEYSTVMQEGDYLYYKIFNEWDEEARKYAYRIYRYDISKRESERMTKPMHNIGFNYAIGEDGSIYDASFSSSMGKDYMWLWKYDAEGEEIYKVDLGAVANVATIDEIGTLIGIFVENDGKVCLVCGKRLIYLDGEGNFLGSLDPTEGSTNTEVLSAGRGKDGKLYALLYSTGISGKKVLLAPDFEKGELRTVDEDFAHSGPITPGFAADFLLNDPEDNTVYDYDVATGTKEALLGWTDNGYKPSGSTSLGVTSDGKILAVWFEPYSQEGKIVLFSKQTVPDKQEIVLGTVISDTVLREGVAKFNKASNRYRVIVKDYMENREWSEQAQEEAWRQMNLELVAGKGPDVIDLRSDKLTAFAEQGFLEDLGPYLKQSEVLSEDSFVGHVLESGICDGRQVAIPKQFQVSTLVGRACEVGGDAGWTLEEFMTFVEKHQGAQVLSSTGKSALLNVCLIGAMDQFVNRKKGKCSFDSKEFIRVLEFADRYGDVSTEGGDTSMGSLIERLQNGEVLLTYSSIMELNWIQFSNERFAGDAGIVGYPSADGGATHRVWVSGMCGIAANSQHKTGAWRFLEYYVTTRYPSASYDMPAVQSCLDALIQEAVSDVAYKTDENGELILDEAGNPVTISKVKRTVRYDDWVFEYKTLTEEEAEQLRKIFETALPESPADAKIREIISEETEGFFGGSKTAEQVAGVIQNRVQLYMNENF